MICTQFDLMYPDVWTICISELSCNVMGECDTLRPVSYHDDLDDTQTSSDLSYLHLLPVDQHGSRDGDIFSFVIHFDLWISKK